VDKRRERTILTNEISPKSVGTGKFCLFYHTLGQESTFAAPGGPVAQYQLDWTDSLKWSNVVRIEDFKGDGVAARLEKAQQALTSRPARNRDFPGRHKTLQFVFPLKPGCPRKDITGVLQKFRHEYVWK